MRDLVTCQYQSTNLCAASTVRRLSPVNEEQMNIPSRTSGVTIPNKRAEPVDEQPVEHKQPKWKQVSVHQGTRPSPRSGHSAVVGAHSMYIFGGRDGNTFKSDLFAFNFGMWKSVNKERCVGHERSCGVER